LGKFHHVCLGRGRRWNGLLRITWIQTGDERICHGVMRKGSNKQRPPVEAVPELLLPPLVDELFSYEPDCNSFTHCGTEGKVFLSRFFSADAGWYRIQ